MLKGEFNGYMRIISFLKSFISAWQDYPVQSGTLLGERFLVHELIGEGSYGLTYKCTDTKDGSLVAVKQSRPSKGAFARQMMKKEGDLLRSLQHSRFPAFVNLFTERNHIFLAMSFFSGNTLEELIFEQGKRYGEQECIDITIQLLELVCYIHDQGLVHLDLRIPNVLIYKDQLYLLDFGLANRVVDRSFPRESDGKAEHKWRKPRGSFKPVDEITDLQDIGHFMLFLLYSNYDSVNKPGNSKGTQPDQDWQNELVISNELKIIIERLLQPQPSYSSSLQLKNDLCRITAKQSALVVP